MKGHARFFCESCGAEVSRSAKNCPGCGRSFASVRCPACDFTGNEELFTGGCPVCGYSSGSNEVPDLPQIKPKKYAAGPLPLWVYVVTVFAVLFVIVALVLILR